MTAYEKGKAAYEEFLESGMLEEIENPFAERSEAGLNWSKGYDEARNAYLR